jgi:transposase
MKAGRQAVPKDSILHSATQVTPDSRLEKRTRRIFKPEYKLRIIQEADACKHGELGALLRREKLYSNQLSDWRREYAENGLSGLSKSIPGPTPSKTVEQRQIEKLEKQVTKLQGDLQTANDCLDIQKKVLSILDRSNNGNTP